MATNYRYDEKTGTYVPDDEKKNDIIHDERLIGILLWAMMFISATFLPIVLSIVAYSYYKDKSEYLYSIAMETLNFQISVLVYGVIGIVIGFITFAVGGIIIFPLLLIYGIVIPVLGILKAMELKSYKPHFTIRFLK